MSDSDKDNQISVSREAMLGFLGHGHPHSAAWFMELQMTFEEATGVRARVNPDQAFRLTYEEAREKISRPLHTLASTIGRLRVAVVSDDPGVERDLTDAAGAVGELRGAFVRTDEDDRTDPPGVGEVEEIWESVTMFDADRRLCRVEADGDRIRLRAIDKRLPTTYVKEKI